MKTTLLILACILVLLPWLPSRCRRCRGWVWSLTEYRIGEDVFQACPRCGRVWE